MIYLTIKSAGVWRLPVPDDERDRAAEILHRAIIENAKATR